MESTTGSGGRKKSFIISHSGKFKSKIKKRISITEQQIWSGPLETPKSKVSGSADDMRILNYRFL